MPQFDFFSFFVQIFWLTIGIFCFFLIYTKYFIVNSSRVIKMREKLKQSSLLLKRSQNSSFGYYDLAIKYFRCK